MDSDRKLIIKALAEKKVTITMEAWYKMPTKSSKESIKARKEGNELFIKSGHNAQVHERIWKFYSQSIAKAPNASEYLALAYGNRSALLLHLKKFKESIIDIDRALKITNSNFLKVKLLCRKTECLAALAMNEVETSLKDANYWLDKVEDKNENKTLIKIIERTKASLESNKSKIQEEVSEVASEKVSTNNNLSSSNSKDDKAKVQKILSEKENADSFESVTLEYNEKYGRHLVASRDIKPGEIIIVVKPNIRCLNLNNSHAFCSHCLKTSWVTIPCDFCHWCMFCSEECKEEAWQKYHDIECNVIPYIMFNQTADYWKQLALKSTIIAIKEAGSIAKLKVELKKIDNCKSKLYKGFLDGKFHNDRVQSIYSLCSNVSSETMEKHVDHAVLTLIILVKSTLLFGEDARFTSNKDLLSNEDVIFIGSLLLKFMKISDINAHSVMEGSSLCRFSNDLNHCQVNRCCERGVCLDAVLSMINHSCYPNVRKCFSEDMHLIVYALQPIKVNSQLFDSYIGYFFDTPTTKRQIMLQEFNFVCDCLPCKEDWPPVVLMKSLFHKSCKEKNNEIEKELLEKHCDLIESTNDENTKYSLDTIDYLSKDIEKAVTHELIQPSYTAAMLISTLWVVFDNVYGMKLQITDKCNDS